VYVAGGYDDIRDGYALMVDGAQQEFRWISTAKCDDAEIDEAVNGADGHANIDDHSLPRFDDDSQEEEAQGYFQEYRSDGVGSAKGDDVLIY
jgi:hypothetical protein